MDDNKTILNKAANTPEVVQKADLQLAELTSSGGVLLPEQAKSFIKILVDESKLNGMVTVVPIGSPKMEIDTIGFGGRLLRAGTSGQALPESSRSKPTLGKVEFDTVLLKGEVRINEEILEDNIEKGTLKDTIISLMAQRAALDIEELVLQGGLDSSDAYLSLINGLLASATTHKVDALNGTITPDLLKAAIKAMPSQWIRDKSKLKFLTSLKCEIDYRNELAGRATTLGDKYLISSEPVGYGGIDMVDIAMFPDTLNASGLLDPTATRTAVLLTDPKNIHIGVCRQIRIVTGYDTSAGQYIIVVSVRADAKFAVEDAVVHLHNVSIAG